MEPAAPASVVYFPAQTWGERKRRFFVAGSVLLVCSLLVHFVCMCTHHYVRVSINDLGPHLARVMKHSVKATQQVAPDGRHSNQSAPKMEGSCHFGMWQFCLNTNESGLYIDTCIGWGTDVRLGTASKTLKTQDWIRAVQAMAILSVMVCLPTTALCAVNLLGKNKGDRRKYLHFFIAAGCIITGLLMLIGDLILAANYTALVDQAAGASPHAPNSLSPSTMAMLSKVFKEHFHLSWGFGLNVLAVVMAWVAGALHLLVIRFASDVYRDNDSWD